MMRLRRIDRRARGGYPRARDCPGYVGRVAAGGIRAVLDAVRARATPPRADAGEDAAEAFLASVEASLADDEMRRLARRLGGTGLLQGRAVIFRASCDEALVLATHAAAAAEESLRPAPEGRR